jgi:P pilus assembly chaperone PapD
MRKTLFALFFLTFLLISTVYAAPEDFQLGLQKKSNDVCSCGFSEQELYIQNSGQIYSNYLVTLDSKSAKYSTVLPSQFSLQPGQQQTVSIMTNAPCGKQASYTSEITVQTDLGTSKTLEQGTNLAKCSNVDLKVQQSGLANCNCVPTVYTMDVKNTNSFLDTYYLSYSADAFVQFSQNPLILGPGESATVYAQVILPCGFNGVEDGKFIAKSAANNDIAEADFSLGTLSCHNTTLDVANHDLCSGKDSKISFSLGNNGKFNTTYNLYMSGARWAEFKAEGIKLKPSESKQQYFTVNTSKPGKYSLNFHVEDTNGIVSLNKKIDVNVSDCSAYKTEMWQVERELCSSSKYDYAIKLSNTGTRLEAFNLSVNVPFAKLNVNKLYIQPGTSQEAMLTVNTPVSGNVSIDLTIDLDGKKQIIPIGFKIVPKTECYLASILESNITFSGNKTAQFTIKNTGRKGTQFIVNSTTKGVITDHQYAFLWPNEKARFYLIGNLSVNKTVNLTMSTLGNANKGSILILKEQKKESLIGWYVAAFVLVVALLLLLFSSRKKEEKEEKIAVERINIPKTKVSVTKTKSLKNANEKRDFSKVQDYVKIAFVVFVITLVGVLVGVYHSSLYNLLLANVFYVLTCIALVCLILVIFDKMFWQSKALKVLISLICFALLVLSIYQVMNIRGAPDTSDESFFRQYFVQGQEHVIDLSQVFIVQNNTINFSVSGNKNVAAKINGSLVRLTSDGWEGSENMTFTATDSNNLSITTPHVTITVFSDNSSDLLRYALLIFSVLVILYLILLRDF